MLCLIESGEVFAPERLGHPSIVLTGSRIGKVGTLDRAALLAFDPECEVIDASSCWVIPGLIDPHQNLLGAGGEQGFHSRIPEVLLPDLLQAGITTVVGVLGTDVITRSLPDLLGKVRQLNAQGITAYMYTGGFTVPPITITENVLSDLVLIDRIIGFGELAVADQRSTEPTLTELSKVVSAGCIGGELTGKAGVTHFHAGPAKQKLKLLHNLMKEYELPPELIYVTHITRSEALLSDAIALAKNGAYVDMDTIEENIGECIEYYLKHGGPPDKLTISSDAHALDAPVSKFYSQFISCIRNHQMELEEVLPFFSTNAAAVLKLKTKGRLAVGMDADILIVDKATFSVKHVIAGGNHLVVDGAIKQPTEDLVLQ